MRYEMAIANINREYGRLAGMLRAMALGQVTMPEPEAVGRLLKDSEEEFTTAVWQLNEWRDDDGE